jgi:DNA-binding transcriptional regulator PaaX
MAMYKYYFRKPKGEIVKDILLWLALGGAVAVAASSPYFGMNLVKYFLKNKKHKPKSTMNAFQRLYKQGCIALEKKRHQYYISLTQEGRKRAGIYQINALEIRRPKQWDKKWRIVIFDIPHRNRFVREVLRGMLKQLGFRLLQKSVWVHPFPCQEEIDLVRSLFGLTVEELRLIIAQDIGESANFKKIFHLS